MDSQEFQQESEVVGSQAEALFNDILTRDDATLEVASADNAASASENVAAQQNDILTQQAEGSQAVGMCGDCFSQLMPSQQSSSRVLYVVMDESQAIEEMQNEPEQAADEDPMHENVIDESNQIAETESRRSFAYFSSTSEDEDSYYSDEEAYQDALSSGSQLAATLSRPMNVMRSRSRSTGSSALNARRHPPSQVLPSTQSRMSKMKAMKKITTPKKAHRRSASKTPRRRRRSTSRSARQVQAKSKTIRKLSTKAARKPTAAVNFVEPQHDVMPPTHSSAMKTPRRRRRARSASRSTRKVQSKSKAIRKQPKKQVKTARKQPPRKATKKSLRKM